jgi:glycosyltransferase involved in cell wall biosynthesis
MGAGLPTVVTDVGGNAEAVIDGVCGFVVPPRDVTRLANALVQLSSDPARRATMGVAARQRMERDFTLDACIDKYLCLYDALLKNGGSVPGIDR